jgi:hypothetical protein
MSDERLRGRSDKVREEKQMIKRARELVASFGDIKYSRRP